MDISLRNLQKRIPLKPLQLPRIVAKILKCEKVKGVQLSFVFVTDRRIKTLNQKYLKRNTSTDVLAFDFKNASSRVKSAKSIIGEVVISTDTIARNAKIFGTTLNSELILCVIHGILHLLGYDDHRPNDTRRMRHKEQQLLKLAVKK